MKQNQNQKYFLYSGTVLLAEFIEIYQNLSISLATEILICQFSVSEALVRKYVGVSVSLATLVTENLLSHPFVVLRRQCQVHHNSRKNHLLAVTLIPVVVRLHQRQGLTTLWKGLGSTLLVRGMTLAAEDLISKFTPWPK